MKTHLWRSVVALTLLWAAAPGSLSSQTTSIASNFNGTSVTNPEYVWFTSHLTSLSGVPASGGTLFFTNQTITITNSTLPGGFITLDVPDGSVTVDPNASAASIAFDAGGSHTVVSSTSNDPILSVLSFPVPLPTSIDLEGSNPVTWNASVSVSWTPTQTVKMNWQWAAAAYDPFTTNYAALDVLPTDQNGLQSGTPLNYINSAAVCINAGGNCVQGGAKGGGGSNYTGSNSGTASLVVTNVTTTPEPTTFALLAPVLLAGVPLFRKRLRA